MLEHDQERYTTKREKMYTFMRIPRFLGLYYYLTFLNILPQGTGEIYVLWFLSLSGLLPLCVHISTSENDVGSDVHCHEISPQMSGNSQ